MADKKLLFQLLKVKSAACLVIATAINPHHPGQAQPIVSVSIFPERQQIYSSKKIQFPDNGAPTGRRRGGTSRNGCPTVKIPLTALVPGHETMDEFQDSTSFLAATVSENTTFWVYIPTLPKKTYFGELIVQNEAQEDIYRTSITLNKTGIVIGISPLLNPKYYLKIGQRYHWYFKIYCQDAEPEAGYFYVDAWIQRVALTPELKLKLQKVKFQNSLTDFDLNIWYDKLTILGKLLGANPQNKNIQFNWNKLLKSVGLENVTHTPVELLVHRE